MCEKFTMLKRADQPRNDDEGAWATEKQMIKETGGTRRVGGEMDRPRARRASAQ